MNWESIRKSYKNTWVLFEALEAHSTDGKRVVEKLSVLDTFTDSREAIKVYQEIHKKEPERELYLANSIHERLDITERKWLGVRK